MIKNIVPTLKQWSPIQTIGELMTSTYYYYPYCLFTIIIIVLGLAELLQHCYVFMVMEIKLAVIFVVVAVINCSSAISYQHNCGHQHSACNRRDNHRRKRLADLHKAVHSCSTNCFDIHQSLKSEFEIFRTLKERENLLQNLRNLNEL